MASSFPGALDSLTNPAGTQTLDTPDHATQHTNANDIIEAIEVDLGTNSGTSILKHFTAGQFPVRHTGVAATGTLVQTLVGGTLNSSNVGSATLGTPTINVGSDAQGDIYYRAAAGNVARLAPGASGAYLKTNGAAQNPSWGTPAGAAVPITNYALSSGDGTATGTAYVSIPGGTLSLVLGAGTYTVCAWAAVGFYGNVANDQARARVVIGTTNGNDSLAGVWSTSSAFANSVLHPMQRLTGQTGTVGVNTQISRQSGSGTVITSNQHTQLMAIAFTE